MKKGVDTNAELQELRKIPANKKCFDCNQAGTTYAIPELGIFLCSICGGIHREFNHRVKGLSTCNFSEAEVNKLKNIGNERAHSSWMAKHDSRTFPVPEVKDAKRMKDFLRMKYLDKRFYENRELGLRVEDKKVEEKRLERVEDVKIEKKSSGFMNLLDDEGMVGVSSGFGAFESGKGDVGVKGNSSVQGFAGNGKNFGWDDGRSVQTGVNLAGNPKTPTQQFNLFDVGGFPAPANVVPQVTNNGSNDPNVFDAFNLFGSAPRVQNPPSTNLFPAPGAPQILSTAPLNPSISPLNPSISPINPPMAALNPSIPPINPPMATINPSVSPLNPPMASNAFNLFPNNAPITNPLNSFNPYQQPNPSNAFPPNPQMYSVNPQNTTQFFPNPQNPYAANPYTANTLATNPQIANSGFGNAAFGFPAQSFESFKPANVNLSRQTVAATGFHSKSTDPFEQLMEEQLEKGLSSSKNPYANTAQGQLVQKYNMTVESYQRTYGMPFPYSFHEWQSMNPQGVASEVRQNRENPFDLYG